VGGGARTAIFAILKAGGPADVVLLPSTDMADMPTVIAMTPLGHISVGVAVKAGMPVPTSPARKKFRNTLLAAKGVAYADPSAGTSAGKLIDRMLSARRNLPGSNVCRFRAWRRRPGRRSGQHSRLQLLRRTGGRQGRRAGRTGARHLWRGRGFFRRDLPWSAQIP